MLPIQPYYSILGAAVSTVYYSITIYFEGVTLWTNQHRNKPVDLISDIFHSLLGHLSSVSISANQSTN